MKAIQTICTLRTENILPKVTSERWLSVPLVKSVSDSSLIILKFCRPLIGVNSYWAAAPPPTFWTTGLDYPWTPFHFLPNCFRSVHDHADAGKNHVVHPEATLTVPCIYGDDVLSALRRKSQKVTAATTPSISPTFATFSVYMQIIYKSSACNLTRVAVRQRIQRQRAATCAVWTGLDWISCCRRYCFPLEYDWWLVLLNIFF